MRSKLMATIMRCRSSMLLSREQPGSKQIFARAQRNTTIRPQTIGKGGRVKGWTGRDEQGVGRFAMELLPCGKISSSSSRGRGRERERGKGGEGREGERRGGFRA